MMDPQERFTTKQALLHPYFESIRTAAEEDQFLKEREKSLKRVESSTNPRGGTATMSRNVDQSRSRSGLRNTKIVKNGALQNSKRFNAQQ